MRIVEMNPNDFDTFAKQHEYANPWQTYSFGSAAEALGYNVLYLGIEEGRIIKGCTLLLTKNVYLGQSISYAPRGPLLDYDNNDFVADAINTLKKYLNDRKIMSFTMDPPVILSVRNKHGVYKKDDAGVDKKLDAILHGGDIIKANPYAKDIVNFLLDKVKLEYRGQNLYFEGILPRWYSVTTLPMNTKTLLSKTDKRVRTKLRKAVKLGVEIFKDETKNINNIAEIVHQTFNRPLEYYNRLIKNNPNCEIYLAKINSEKYVNNSKILYERELERNEILNRLIREKSSRRKGMRHALNQKMESDKIINSYKEHLVASTQTLRNNPNGKIVAMCIVTKDINGVHIFEDGYLKEFGNLNAMSLLRWKVLEVYSNSEFRTFDFGAITGGFDKRRNPMYGLNEARLSLRGYVMEYIGEFGVMTNKTMYNLYQASVRDRQNFKL